jgi:hypothetical protein
MTKPSESAFDGFFPMGRLLQIRFQTRHLDRDNSSHRHNRVRENFFFHFALERASTTAV